MKLNTAAAPHFRTKDSTRKVMSDVLIALTPAVIASTWIFGLRALYIMLLSMISAEVLDLIIVKYIRNKKNYKPDLSASVTGLLLGMNLSMAVTWYQILIGVLVAIVIGKHVYGGLGQNIFNPALVGRVFMIISFPTAMTTWVKPFYYQNISNTISLKSIDAYTGASALGIAGSEGFQNSLSQYSYWDMFIGKIPGSIGEVSALFLIIGFLFLALKGRIKLTVPLTYIGTVLIFSGIFYTINPEKYGTPLFHILAGGLILGALFMATDMVTSPMTKKGQFVYGLGMGIITMVIRYFGSYPEGVSFSILIMNALVPLIDIWAKPRIFGTSKKEVAK
ncbi:RnfABCDGE type electron transport complex subunit D [Oceanotoga teriensis]|uniref:Ion-translocating oxidoreductase complex subunit D n=1 Tax=Oceanotoga teriensis TaxID=515440 RepID=A0AA45C9A4_9BACT|nr:RnfABCDGE type electron transport complex subunit D [Oceanotoga teriensis]MDO7975368.1 RnfABCDGE type electron transport complex subunit D [Oceanotoga teriensis]PWJ96700.1 electron transport complex protein RnfD [Oceanotoga teriensis]